MKTARPVRVKPLPRARRSGPARAAKAHDVARVGVAKTVELAALRVRLIEAEETLRAIRTGEADAVVTAGKHGIQVFTLEGAGDAYRVLIESMNEGALTLTTDKMILYANQCFARMVKCPLEQVMGGSLRRFLSSEDQAALRPLLHAAGRAGAKIQVMLQAHDGTQIPVQISLRQIARRGLSDATIGMVVTDLSETRRNEERLRALTHRVVQVQEEERGRVAVELHDNITQLLCGVLFRSQALADGLSPRHGPAKAEALELRRILGEAAAEVERIARDLRPSVLGQLGLDAVLRSTGKEFAARAGLVMTFTEKPLTVRLPADAELALFRIFHEALRNVRAHARAHRVTVTLGLLPGAVVELKIRDDGVGFASDELRAGPNGKDNLGLLSMRERATYAGGTLKVSSQRRTGTTIAVRIPVH